MKRANLEDSSVFMVPGNALLTLQAALVLDVCFAINERETEREKVREPRHQDSPEKEKREREQQRKIQGQYTVETLPLYASTIARR